MNESNGPKMARTQSERIFERYCSDRQIAWERIAEDAGLTPDYELKILNRIVVVEVKEIDRSKEELESDKMLEQRNYGHVLSCIPGDRVRKKINDSYRQIKARTARKHSGLLVLFDRGRSYDHLDSYHVRVAMYGLEQVHIALPSIGSAPPYATGMSYGPKWKMSPNSNTSISAIGVLSVAGPNQVVLSVYHNRFAAIPLPIKLLGISGVEQFVLEDKYPGTTAKWKEVSFQPH